MDTNDQKCIDHILSGFFETGVSLQQGIIPKLSGRSFKLDKHYRLDVSNKRHVGLKRKYKKNIDFDKELIVKEIRTLLGIPFYKIIKEKGCPMDVNTWRQSEYLLSDWGEFDKRIDLKKLQITDISSIDKNLFLEQLAENAALSCILGLSDRSPRNFIWDTNEKTVFTIDHEDFIKSPKPDEKILGEISETISKFFSKDWYDYEDYQNRFVQSFNKIWNRVLELITNIKEIFIKYTLKSSYSLLSARLKLPSDVYISLIFR